MFNGGFIFSHDEQLYPSSSLSSKEGQSKGLLGSRGKRGKQGSQGSRGTKGKTGKRGKTGPVGAQGEPGGPGVIGLVGAVGLEGLLGPIGAEGSIGAEGALGLLGPIGATGATGLIGTNGITGPTGPIGSTGSTGPTGEEAVGAFERAYAFFTNRGIPTAQFANAFANVQIDFGTLEQARGITVFASNTLTIPGGVYLVTVDVCIQYNSSSGNQPLLTIENNSTIINMFQEQILPTLSTSPPMAGRIYMQRIVTLQAGSFHVNVLPGSNDLTLIASTAIFPLSYTRSVRLIQLSQEVHP